MLQNHLYNKFTLNKLVGGGNHLYNKFTLNKLVGGGKVQYEVLAWMGRYGIQVTKASPYPESTWFSSLLFQRCNRAQLVSKLQSPNLVFDPEEHQYNANHNGNRGVLPNQGLT
jgi:hypothetical protein